MESVEVELTGPPVAVPVSAETALNGHLPALLSSVVVRMGLSAIGSSSGRTAVWNYSNIGFRCDGKHESKPPPRFARPKGAAFCPAKEGGTTQRSMSQIPLFETDRDRGKSREFVTGPSTVLRSHCSRTATRRRKLSPEYEITTFGGALLFSRSRLMRGPPPGTKTGRQISAPGRNLQGPRPCAQTTIVYNSGIIGDGHESSSLPPLFHMVGGTFVPKFSYARRSVPESRGLSRRSVAAVLIFAARR